MIVFNIIALIVREQYFSNAEPRAFLVTHPLFLPHLLFALRLAVRSTAFYYVLNRDALQLGYLGTEWLQRNFSSAILP